MQQDIELDLEGALDWQIIKRARVSHRIGHIRVQQRHLPTPGYQTIGLYGEVTRQEAGFQDQLSKNYSTFPGQNYYPLR